MKYSAALIFLFATTATAQTPVTWVGPAGSWNIGSNWSGGVPSSSSNVVIDNTSLVTPTQITVDTPSAANSLLMTKPAELVLNDALVIGSGGLNIPTLLHIDGADHQLRVNGTTTVSRNLGASYGGVLRIQGDGLHTTPLLKTDRMVIGSYGMFSQVLAGDTVGWSFLGVDIPALEAGSIIVGDHAQGTLSGDFVRVIGQQGVADALVLGDESGVGSGGLYLQNLEVVGNLRMGPNVSNKIEHGTATGSNAPIPPSVLSATNLFVDGGTIDLQQTGVMNIAQDLIIGANGYLGTDAASTQSPARYEINVGGKMEIQAGPPNYWLRSIAANIDAGELDIQRDGNFFGKINTALLNVSSLETSDAAERGMIINGGSLGSDITPIGSIELTGGRVNVKGGGSAVADTLSLSAKNGVDSQFVVEDGSLRVTGLTSLGAGSTLSVLADGTAEFNDLSISNATLEVIGGTVQTLGSLMLDNASIVSSNGADLSFATVSLSTGTLAFNGNIANDLTQSGGLLAPGNSPGTVTIGGDYVLNGGILQMELGGTGAGEFDRLIATDAVLDSANSQLQVIYFGGFSAVLGDEFDLFDFGTVTGNFGLIELPDLDSSLAWNDSELLTTGRLSVISAVAVPEPSSLIAMVGCGAFLAYRRRRRSR